MHPNSTNCDKTRYINFLGDCKIAVSNNKGKVGKIELKQGGLGRTGEKSSNQFRNWF